MTGSGSMTGCRSSQKSGYYVADDGGAERTEGESNLVRSNTWDLINDDENDGGASPIFILASSSVNSDASTRQVSGETTASGRKSRSSFKMSRPPSIDPAEFETLQQVAWLVEQSYDILPAESMLIELESMMGGERFQEEVMPSDLYKCFSRRMDFFHDVGLSCGEDQQDWMEVYNGENGKQMITGFIDKDDPTELHYCVRCQIPASLTHVLTVANEIELMPTWNALIVNQPETIGRRTAHYMVLNYQMSVMGGLYKLDALNEIRRFTDRTGGFLVEYVTSVPPEHPSYKEPLKGHKRMQTLLKNVFVACGPDTTILIQRGKLKLPFTVTKWFAKILGGIAGKFVLGGLINNASMPGKPGNLWEACVKDDKLGFYQRLDELTSSAESESRDPKQTQDGKVPDYDLEALFKKHAFHRPDFDKGFEPLYTSFSGPKSEGNLHVED